MRKVYYNKLIRDRIPEKIERKGEQCDVRPLDEEEFGQELLKKVAEEAQALARVRDREELLDELADLLLVLDTLTAHFDIKSEELEKARKQNLARKGGFEHRLFLHWSSDSGYRSNESVQGLPAHQEHDAR